MERRLGRAAQHPLLGRPHPGVTGAIYSQFLPFVTPEALQMYEDFERALYAAL